MPESVFAIGILALTVTNTIDIVTHEDQPVVFTEAFKRHLDEFKDSEGQTWKEIFDTTEEVDDNNIFNLMKNLQPVNN